MKKMEINEILTIAGDSMKKMPIGKIFNGKWFCVTSKSYYANIEEEGTVRVCEINVYAEYNGDNFDVWAYIENDDFEMFPKNEFNSLEDAEKYVSSIVTIEEIETDF